jgi:preprotein translocase subunit SecA
MGDTAREEVGQVIQRLVDEHTPGDYIEEWDLGGLFTAVDDVFPPDFAPEGFEAQQGTDRIEVVDRLTADAITLYDRREEELGSELMRALERYLLLQTIDTRWREHLYDMDYLREGIHLRGFAQIEPIVAYKNEAFTLFGDLMNTIWSDFTRMIFNVEVEVEGANGSTAERYDAPGAQPRPARVSYSGGGPDQPSALAAAAAGAPPDEAAAYAGEQDPAAAPVEPVRQRVLSEDEQVGRNEPCWCGSGRKFKKCHGA